MRQGFFSCIVLGNKIDLRNHKLNCVTDKEAEDYCTKLSENFKRGNIRIKYFPVSVLSELNIEKSLTYLYQSLISQYLKE